MLVKSLIILIIRKGEELKAPCHASAAATRDIFPILIKYILNIEIIKIIKIIKLYFYICLLLGMRQAVVM